MELDGDGQPRTGWCFLPEGNLVAGRRDACAKDCAGDWWVRRSGCCTTVSCAAAIGPGL